MKLLLDTDVFCKLGSCSLLRPAIQAVGLEISDCGRLPALPHQISGGWCRRDYPAAAREELGHLVAAIPACAQADDIPDFQTDPLPVDGRYRVPYRERRRQRHAASARRSGA